MRRAEERTIWKTLQKGRAGESPQIFDMGNSSSIDLASPCIVLGGRNGAGKSRLLRALANHIGEKALLIDLHHLCEQALIVLRSRADFDAMLEEFDPSGPSADRLEDVQRVIGREYESIEWFALEVEPDDPMIAERFRWAGEEPRQTLLPYFSAHFRGQHYTARDMGLGEFSIHFLFWIFELLRGETDIVLLLDEPDAYLPPVGVESLLARILNLCRERQWQAILSTHSEEMITLAIEHRAFTLLQLDENGQTVASHSADDPMVGNTLLSRPPVDRVVFCEDEVACALTRSLLDAVDPILSKRVAVLWGGEGHGSLRMLLKHLPRPPRARVRFAYVFDGDQRGTVEEDRTDRWGTIFLPTADDPNVLLKSLAGEREVLANRLGVLLAHLSEKLDGLEGEDVHDWLDLLGEEFGRQLVLTSLSALWAENHYDEAVAFVSELQAKW